MGFGEAGMMGDRHLLPHQRFSLASIPEDVVISDYNTGFEIFGDDEDEDGR